jgi:branched-chain amino acid transport system permease protein
MSPLHRVLACAGLAVVVITPFFFTPYWNSQFTLALVYAVAASGLNVLTGYNGQISLGHGAFFALGAYIAAVLVTRTGIPWLVTLPIAGATAFVTGFAFGGPALRLTGLYLAVVTLGLSVAAPLIIKRAHSLTGGSQGLVVPVPEVPGWLPLAQDQFLYFVALIPALLGLGVAWNVSRRQTGRALVAVRDNTIAARTFGINAATVKMRAFGISAMYAGVSGALYVFVIGFISPDDVTLLLSLGFVTAIVVGGLGTVTGAVFGALFIQIVPRYATEVNDVLTGVVYGAALIVVMYLMPGGIVGTSALLWRRWAPEPWQRKATGSPAALPQLAAPSVASDVRLTREAASRPNGGDTL